MCQSLSMGWTMLVVATFTSAEMFGLSIGDAVMRYFLLVTMLAVGAGCQTMGDRGGTSTVSRSDDKNRHKQAFVGMMNTLQENDAKKTSDAPKTEPVKMLPDNVKVIDINDGNRVPSTTPDMFLVPKMVYVPY